jgi:hypothetical protein
MAWSNSNPRSLVRLRDGRLAVLRVRIGQGGGGMALGLHRRQTGPRELLRLQMSFGPLDGGLGRVEIRRGRGRRPGHAGRGDGLPRIAHFLHGRTTSASDEVDNTDQYSNKAQHE